jgi:hypothetical protein
MTSNCSQLNPDKIELLWCSAATQLRQLQLQPIKLGAGLIEQCSVIRDVDVFIDSNLSMRSLMLKVVGSCYSVPRQLRRIRRSVPVDVFQMLVGSLVIIRST